MNWSLRVKVHEKSHFYWLFLEENDSWNYPDKDQKHVVDLTDIIANILTKGGSFYYRWI